MGLKLRVNVFFDVTHTDVYGAMAHYYASIHRPLQSSGSPSYCHDIHTQEGRSVVVSLGAGWDVWSLWRDALRFVSQSLNCAGFLLFVYDGDYWGYELVAAGEAVDHFISDPEFAEGTDWFLGMSIAGNAEVVATHLPFLAAEKLGPYLIQRPVEEDFATFAEWRAADKQLNVPPHPGDAFTRFNECAMINFLRFIGVQVVEDAGVLTFRAPIWRSFWIQYRQ